MLKLNDVCDKVSSKWSGGCDVYTGGRLGEGSEWRPQAATSYGTSY